MITVLVHIENIW